MTVATFLTVWGIWTLRRSFSITVDARTMVVAGPYRLVRHPVYLGEMLATAGVAVLHFSPLNLLLVFCFITLQLVRARMEERKLSCNFPEYSCYARKTFWFLPFAAEVTRR